MQIIRLSWKNVLFTTHETHPYLIWSLCRRSGWSKILTKVISHMIGKFNFYNIISYRLICTNNYISLAALCYLTNHSMYFCSRVSKGAHIYYKKLYLILAWHCMERCKVIWYIHSKVVRFNGYINARIQLIQNHIWFNILPPSTKIALIRPTIPAAISKFSIFLFTDPTTKLCDVNHLSYNSTNTPDNVYINYSTISISSNVIHIIRLNVGHHQCLLDDHFLS